MADATTESRTSHLAGQEQEHLVIAFFALYKMARLVDRSNRTFTDKRDDFYRRLMAELERVCRFTGLDDIKMEDGWLRVPL